MTKMSKKPKYKIKEKLQSLPLDDFKIAQQNLPLVLNISSRTFKRWQDAKVGDKLEIPCDKLATIAKCLNTPIEKMFNFNIPEYNLKKLSSISVEDICNEFGLSKQKR